MLPSGQLPCLGPITMKFEQGKVYELRDPIHRSIYFDSFEKKFIDHPIFQRLRAIAQLGFVSLAYPGANHSRFIHSLGVMHLAGRIFRQIVANNEPLFKSFFSVKAVKYFYKIIRLGGLLHDVGHAPFSHSMESLLPPIDQIDIPAAWFIKVDTGRQSSHEDFSVLLIYQLLVVQSKLLSIEEAQDICSLIHKNIKPSSVFFSDYGVTGIHAVLSNIISGEVDADRMDYLLRDSYYAGVTYGNFDLERVVGSLSALDSDGIKLGMDHNAIYTFEDFLLARYHMFLQVYFHKTPLCFDYYLKQAIANDEIQVNIDGNVDRYLQLTDDSIHNQIRTKKTKYWISKIYLRQPSKLIRNFNTDTPKKTKSQVDKLKNTLAAAGCHPFVMEASQYLSNLIPFSDQSKSTLYVVKRFFGSQVLEPIADNSKLIERYNERIHMINLYCLPEYKDRALKVVKAFLPQETF